MTERDAQSVRRVVGAGNRSKPQVRCDDPLHLSLIRLTVTRKRLLDLVRRVFKDSPATLAARHKRHSAGMRNGDSRRNIFTEKQLFHRRFIGRKLIKNVIDPLFEHTQTNGEILILRRSDNAVVDRSAVPPQILFNHAVSHCPDPGIDS